GSGMQLVVMLAQNDEHHAQASSFVRAGHVDGVILVSVHEDDPLPGQLARARIPFVLGGRPSTPLPGATYVDVDNRLGARLATERLLATGHQRIATITGPPDMTASRDRLAGFRETLRDAGVRAAGVAHGRFTRESGVAAMGELLETEPDLDAVFAANDLMAVGALSALREAGRRVPDDVAVVGFDDIALAQDVEPALTTVHQPVAEEARLMTQEVLRQIRGEPAGEPVVLAPRLVVRASG
ncbi:MAG: substrate-binding domain-containing protein, partial [Actinomycetota bacterium]